MNFIEAAKLLKLDRNIKIHRKDRPFKIGLDKIGVFFRCYMFDRQIDEFVATTGDISADDWEIYKKEPELHTFVEAIVALKNGKTIKRKLWTTKVIERDFCDDYSVEFTIDDFEARDWIILENEVIK